ncbi:hypothetical protein [Streptomyces hyaluromycini]|uniref:hypothetical protein n=1 Tax=Streptomyces hyaluromycini TaxID=1377993 RepID=UPI0034CF0B82
MDTIPPFLDHLVLATPDLAELRPLLAALGTELTLSAGPVSLSFIVGTPHGPVTFG